MAKPNNMKSEDSLVDYRPIDPKHSKETFAANNPVLQQKRDELHPNPRKDEFPEKNESSLTQFDASYEIANDQDTEGFTEEETFEPSRGQHFFAHSTSTLGQNPNIRPNAIPIYYSSADGESGVDIADIDERHRLMRRIEELEAMNARLRSKRSGEETHGVSSDGNDPTKKDSRIDYEMLHWFVILFTSLIAVIDRYTTNYWPMGVGSAGPTIPGNFGVTVYAIIAWVSARSLLISSSYIFFVKNFVFWNWIVENKVVNKYIKIGDIQVSNKRLHHCLGWYFIGIPVLLHVWSIMFAALFPQNSLVVYSSWKRPVKFWNQAENVLSLGGNDVFRLISTTITFGILFPYSLMKFSRKLNWSFAQWVHMLGAAVYTIDLIRIASHPHCWVFNVPFIFWWMCDRIYGIFWYRRSVAVLVKKTRLDDDFVACYLRVPDEIASKKGVGDVFWFNFLDSAAGFDRAHPFTCFWNHQNKHKLIGDEKELKRDWKGHKFSIYNAKKRRTLGNSITKGMDTDDESEWMMSRLTTDPTEDSKRQARALSASYFGKKPVEDTDDIEEIAKGFKVAAQPAKVVKIQEECDWNLGIIMQIFPDRTDCNKRKTWTSKVQRIDPRHFPGLRTWGPYRTEYRILVQVPGQNVYPSTPIVAIGTGAGCSFLLDYYFYIIGNNIDLQKKVIIYFSTRSIGMFQWFTDITCRRHHKNLYVGAHLTSNDKVKYQPKGQKSRESTIGRMDIEGILDSASVDAHIYYCGSPSIQGWIGNLCEDRGLLFHAGHSFN